MPTPVDFYFDFSSPYGYFASFKIDDIAEPCGRETAWHPIMIGAAFKESGNLPLIHQPLKGAYSAHDWARLSRFMDVPWQLPEPFPIATHNAARLYYGLAARDRALAKRFAQAAFHAYFGEGRDITAIADVARVAAPLGLEAAEVERIVSDPAMKEDLRKRTADAIAKGVMGSPYIIVDGEGFWGSDRLWMVKKWLQTGGW